MQAILKKGLREFIILALATLLICIITPFAYAQESTIKPNELDGAPVVLAGEKLFFIQKKIGPYSPEDRAKAISKRIEAIAQDQSIPVDSLKIEDQKDSADIVVNDRIILTITDDDAKAANINRQKLSIGYLQKIKDSIKQYRESRSLENILLGVLYSFIATIILWIFFRVSNQIFSGIYAQFDSWGSTMIPALRIQNLEILPATQIADILIRLIKTLRLALILGVLYLYDLLLLSFFPWTRPFGASLSSYLLEKLFVGLQAFLSYLPNLFVIALVILVTYYILKLFKFIFSKIGSGMLAFPGFYPEWAEPTYKLVTFLIIALAAVVVFPYFPGAQSPAFQGISIFLGLLVSLGSSSAIANVVAGVILIYTRAFQIGDRVKIGDAMGDIVEKTLLVTRIRTPKNVVITIPNATVLNSQIVNYSALATAPGNNLILHTTVTLGYDLPWRKVHETLIRAACATQDILAEPAPFVLQTSLDDSYVSYELNAYTDKPIIMAGIYSELHQNIQDKCNEVGIEILSPHYRAVRDGNQNTIPENYLPKDYVAPGFKISPVDNFSHPSDSKSKANGQELTEAQDE
jgi:small-conductance mechanosensitive channel